MKELVSREKDGYSYMILSFMTPDERMEEVAEILATGILRIRQKKITGKYRKGETIYLDKLAAKCLLL